MSLIYAYEDRDEKLETFDVLFKECLEQHTPLKRIEVKRPPCPWLKSDDILELQCERNQLRFLAHKSLSNYVWQAYRKVRNTLKTTIKKVKRAFYATALSSKKLKKIWQVINCILHPSPQPIQCNPDDLNNHFASTAYRTLQSPETNQVDWNY